MENITNPEPVHKRKIQKEQAFLIQTSTSKIYS